METKNTKTTDKTHVPAVGVNDIVSQIDCSVKLHSFCRRANIVTLGELASLLTIDLLLLHRGGRKTLVEAKEVLAREGLRLSSAGDLPVGVLACPNSARDKAVLAMAACGDTYAEIGKLFGISGERVRQVCRKTIKRLTYINKGISDLHIQGKLGIERHGDVIISELFGLKG